MCWNAGVNTMQVKRWTTERHMRETAYQSMFDCDRVIVPINIGNLHWVCVGIDLQHQQIVYLDSLAGEESSILELLLQYMDDESKVSCSSTPEYCLLGSALDATYVDPVQSL